MIILIIMMMTWRVLGLCDRVWEPHGFSNIWFWVLECVGLLHCRFLYVTVSLVYLYCLLSKAAIILIFYAINVEDHFLCYTETSIYLCCNLLEMIRETP